MTPESWFWFFVILSAALVVGEVFTASFFLFPFGIGAAAAAAANGVFDASAAMQWATFVVVSVPVLAASKMFTNVSGPQGTVGVVSDRLDGAVGIVEETVHGRGATGMIRVSGEEWSAWTEDSSAIPAGSEVDVLRIDGAHLVVRPHRPEQPVGIEGGSQ